MNTDITDTTQENDIVLYDGACRNCVRFAERFRALLAHQEFQLAPLQTPWVRERLGLDGSNLLSEMRLLKAGGEVLGGADALVEISRRYWWAWPIHQLARIDPVMRLLRAGYRWIARHRHCAGGACAIRRVFLETP